MRTIIAAVIIALTLPSALAGERHGDAALGALTGAVVLGPVGLVAGAVVGYTAGPSIARSWRNNRHHPRSQARAAKSARVASGQRAPSTAPGEVTPAKPAPGVGGPPVQGLD
jgi:hypothetical protein